MQRIWYSSEARQALRKVGIIRWVTCCVAPVAKGVSSMLDPNVIIT
ncbi:MAG: hypothetical protein ABS917_16535 [Solibacillus sp.]